jgi:lambda repressor-like predicted transcriptional regulator
MTPSEIKVALEKRKTSLANLARELGVANSSVTNVLYRRMYSKRIESAIAEALEKPLHKVFPDRYLRPDGYQEPLMIEISTVELASIRESLARATQVIDRFCVA